MSDIVIAKGIPFARAERFGAPRPVALADTIELPGTYGPQCPQVLGIMEQMLGQASLASAEDCLSLNVFTPGLDQGRRPVLVWIHGGAFTNGTGATPWYHGASLARRYDVVVVTINYRLGAFGFSHLADHGGADFADCGNLGLADQIEALRWVRDHVTGFGGDADNVTIFGESAGGASVVALMAAPAAHGLFHGAVALSPSLGQLRSRQRAHEAAGELLRAAGVDPAGLRRLSTEELLTAQRTVLAGPSGWITSFAPTPGEPTLPDDVVAAAAANPVPLMIGTTKDEMLLFAMGDPRLANMDGAALAASADQRFGPRATSALAAYERLRPGASPGAIAAAIATDEGFRRPAQLLAAARSAAGHRTWMHWFTWETPVFGGILKSCHALDIPFAFHNLDRKGVEAFTGDGDDRQQLADAVSGAIASFARRRDPGWDAYDTSRRVTMRFDRHSGPVEDPEGELRDLWEHSA
jgi:para-nitrobenzyl esterase